MHLSVESRARVRVPENAFAGDEPLAVVERGGMVGSLHRGTVVVTSPDGEILLAVGDPDQPAFLRSAAKPFQATPAVLTGGVDRFGITERELAVLCASHNGEPRHEDVVLSVLGKIGLAENDLLCGVHAPLHEESAAERWREGRNPTPVCNNCSGVHAAMLVACRAAGWPLDTYDQPDHPLQQLTMEMLGAFADVQPGRIEYGVDNCTVPTFRLPMFRAAQAFARLARPNAVSGELAGAARRIVAAMTSYPEMVGGKDRFDTDLMNATVGSIVCKGGAEGFEGVGLLKRGAGIAVKITDGDSRAIPPVVLSVIEALQPLDTPERDALRSHAAPSVHDRRGHTVGRIVPVFEIGSPS